MKRYQKRNEHLILSNFPAGSQMIGARKKVMGALYSFSCITPLSANQAQLFLGQTSNWNVASERWKHRPAAQMRFLQTYVKAFLSVAEI